MSHFLNRYDELSRRKFMSYLMRGLVGVGLTPHFFNLLTPRAQAATGTAEQAQKVAASLGRPTARNVIYLYMAGGMSQLDTFDTKPGHELQGPVKSIATAADGISVSEYLPTLAMHMDKVAVIRSMNSNQGAHEQGNYFMHTSYPQRGTIQHPGLGAWITRLSGVNNSTLPANVRIGGGSNAYGGAGFLESRYEPLHIDRPDQGLSHSQRRKHISEEEFNTGLSIADEMDYEFHKRYNYKKVRAYRDMYNDAIALMNSEDLKAFDISEESDAVRKEYGNDRFGQGCLLARRLVEHDVRFVEVSLGGWDTHNNNFDGVADLAAKLDQGMAALLHDLERRGLLDETLVVLATEFGRTPAINENDGRDHYPAAFTCALAGGGIRGGQVYGETDESGGAIVRDKVTIPDFHATMGYALGLNLDEVVESPSRRPFTFADKGKPITALFG